MQDPSIYAQIKSQLQQQQHNQNNTNQQIFQLDHHHHDHQQQQEHQHLKCPRCDSDNTKFCYYNNYNLSQPRHFCKACKRYWTKGGTLRNIPVGGATRKNTSSKRPASTSSPSKRPAPALPEATAVAPACNNRDDQFGGQFGNFVDVSENFSSLLDSSSEGQFGNFDETGRFGGSGTGQGVERGLGSGGSENWSGGSSDNGWPDLAMYPPGSSFNHH